MIESEYDVAIIGGGPAGSTVCALLKKYWPQAKVVIFERESFPRDHVGESQLPHVSAILDEMGVWDKVERAGFPIKVGATYRWGKSDRLWDFEFIQDGAFVSEARPGKYAGQRTQTAFQVDRALYDKILLDHARGQGGDVFEAAKVTSVEHAGDRIVSLTVQHKDVTQRVKARHYVDCSGHTGVMRKAMGVETECPTTLQNIAIWDYWQNAEWAVSIGVGGTRVQVLSLGYGWIWFIPLGPTRTSIGLIVPAQYYKETGLRPEEMYERALASDPIIQGLTKNAVSENKLSTTKDWSFLAERLSGENWFLAGESSGFADPILAAGMTLAHRGAREVAYTILELERGELDPSWLKSRYSDGHRRSIMQHIRFADFWYTQNGLFSELKNFTRQIAGEVGLNMTSDEAWRWFGTGGFIDHDRVAADVAGFALHAAKNIASSFLGEEVEYRISGRTHFKLNLEEASRSWGADVANGRIRRHRCYTREGQSLPMVGIWAWFARMLGQERTAQEIMDAANIHREFGGMSREEQIRFPREMVEALETLVLDGWVVTRTVEDFEPWPKFVVDCEGFMHLNRDIALRFSNC
ncbi:MAG: NAD(P)/FAD-dependent oxidoreductase [Alphaproteobacteria bacterium]|nr:MAG: NAD(P)/FAD-dependent oxidoreductase [Alphaproteobacteria bacterium]